VPVDDALIIGAGPAGASAAILLAQDGWRVSIIEQHSFPRDKVCGGCIAAGNFELLDALGVGATARRLAGEELRRVGWMRADATLTAPMPPCSGSRDGYGRALGRDVLDQLLLERAAAVGVHIIQPAKARTIAGRPGQFQCQVESMRARSARRSTARSMGLAARLVIDAHGSWEGAPLFEAAASHREGCKPAPRASDLFAFKASFAGSSLPTGLLPVVALEGGYGGMVVANANSTTVALCLRRDKLRAIRARHRLGAAEAAEFHLRESCLGIREALRGARRTGPWLTVGPLRPGTRLRQSAGLFAVGNAAGECHPLIGEGISMALQSSKLLAGILRSRQDHIGDPRVLRALHQSYRTAWRRAFAPRLRFASLSAHVAMRAPLAALVERWIGRWPSALTVAARLGGKARSAAGYPEFNEVAA
jgi:menaquinone-9 beta-reductase